ncbi:hypothetical protein LMH73_017530 [Vibrio splendidus]|nr:hypothetical protein [Vibrio splendidus]MCC4880338.1 hypothetical protein [Vibrio splendidus]
MPERMVYLLILLLIFAIIIVLALLFSVNSGSDNNNEAKQKFLSIKLSSTEKYRFKNDYEFDLDSFIAVSSETNSLICVINNEPVFRCFSELSYITTSQYSDFGNITNYINLIFKDGSVAEVPFRNNLNHTVRLHSLIKDALKRDPFSRQNNVPLNNSTQEVCIHASYCNLNVS